MKKRWTGILILTILGVFLYHIFSTSESYLLEYTGNEEEIEFVKEQRHSLEQPILKELIFDNERLNYDYATNTWFCSINEASLEGFAPKISYVAVNENVKLCFENFKVTHDSIRNSDTIEVLAYDDQICRTYHIAFTTLPIMHIVCSTEPSDSDVRVSMCLFDNDMQEEIVSEGLMHIRGGTSRAYPKKGYKLSLTKNKGDAKNKISLLGLREDDDWVLYAAYSDSDKVRNVFSTNLWKETCAKDNELGIDNGNEYKYIELFINDSYEGLYAIGYPIDKKQLEIKDNEHLYKKKYWVCEAVTDFESVEPLAGYELITPQTSDTWKILKEVFFDIFSNPEVSYENLCQKMDVDNVVDTYLFIDLVQGVDTASDYNFHNMYLSAKWVEDHYKVLYTPWDLDQSWGNIWSDEANNHIDNYGIEADQSVILRNSYVSALLAVNDVRMQETLSNKYLSLRKDGWSDETINEKIDMYEEQIFGSGAYLRDMRRWPEGNYQPSVNGLTEFRKYVMKRLEFMDKEFAG